MFSTSWDSQSATPSVADRRSDSKDDIGSAPPWWNETDPQPSGDAYPDLLRLGPPGQAVQPEAEGDQQDAGGDRVSPDHPDQRQCPGAGRDDQGQAEQDREDPAQGEHPFAVD